MRLTETPVLYAVELTGCTEMARLSAESVLATFAEVLTTAGATVVQRLSHCFPGIGQTCVLILAESHAVLHIWPETGTVNVDIFSCSGRLKSNAAIAELGRVFGATLISVQEVLRADGHLPPSDGRH